MKQPKQKIHLLSNEVWTAYFSPGNLFMRSFSLPNFCQTFLSSDHVTVSTKKQSKTATSGH